MKVGFNAVMPKESKSLCYFNPKKNKKNRSQIIALLIKRMGMDIFIILLYLNHRRMISTSGNAFVL